MMLSDMHLKKLAEIHGLINPFIKENCEGATINLTLGSVIKKPVHTRMIILGEKLEESMYETVNILERDFILNPNESVLVHSNETFKIPTNMSGLIIEKYSLKLTGLVISPASYMNPGYQGNMTFLATNHSPSPIKLVPGFKFCQLAIIELSSEADKPYQLQNKSYMGTSMVTISRMHLDREIQEFLKLNGVDNVSTEESHELGKYLMSHIDEAAESIAELMRKEFGDPNAE